MPTPGIHQSNEVQTNHRNSSTNYTSGQNPPIKSSSYVKEELGNSSLEKSSNGMYVGSGPSPKTDSDAGLWKCLVICILNHLSPYEGRDGGDSSTSEGARKVTWKCPGKTDSSSQPSEGTDYAGTLRSDF